MNEKFEKISIIVLCVIGFFIFIGTFASDSNDTTQEVVEYEKISAFELFKQYEENSVRADSIYKDKTYTITGKVHDIGTELLGNNYVTLEVNDNQYQITSVQCIFKDSEESKVTTLNKGDDVSITGRIDGLTMNVLVYDCVLN